MRLLMWGTLGLPLMSHNQYELQGPRKDGPLFRQAVMDGGEQSYGRPVLSRRCPRTPGGKAVSASGSSG